MLFKTPKTLVVCDYDNPKNYTFPSFGLGSSEKRIWHFAKTASEMDDFRVIITGPNWLPEYVPKAEYFPERLNAETVDKFIGRYGKCDFLFAGMEYFDKDEWMTPFRKCSQIRFSYQLHPYDYKKIAFDGKREILFCYSNEMCEKYRNQKPIKQLLFHSGVDEEPIFSEVGEDYLLWIGRLDRQKAPHLAVRASEILGKKLIILGKTVYEPEYFEEFRSYFQQKHVAMLGMKFGHEKMEIISKAKCALYTLDCNYYEAGAGVLGEILASGVPIAGISWRGGDAVCAAVDDPRLGVVSILCREEPDEDAARKLAKNVQKCLELSREEVFRLGSNKYDPKKLVIELFEKIKQINPDVII